MGVARFPRKSSNRAVFSSVFFCFISFIAKLGGGGGSSQSRMVYLVPQLGIESHFLCSFHLFLTI